MTDKEQIIIHGVNVSECLFYQSNFEEDYDVKIKHFCSNWHNSCESVNNSNCYFKQLARKTQECKELKQYQEDAEKVLKNILDNFDKMENRYRKALEEIEGIIKSSTKDFNHIDWEAKASHALTAVDKISDIINKAKGE